MTKKQINWIIGIVASLIAIVLGFASIYKESWILFFVITVAILLLSLSYLFYSLYKKAVRDPFEKRNKQFEKILKEKEDKIQMLQNNTCQECTKIYVYYYPNDEWISFKEKPNKNECFSIIEKMSDEGKEQRSVYHLKNQWIFVSFWDKKEGDYLIDLIGKEIYLPIGKAQESKRDSLLSYVILCSKRRNHFGIEELNRFI